VHDIFIKSYNPIPNQKFHFQIKKYLKTCEIESLIEFGQKLNYTSRGIIFKPMFIKNKDILYNFDDSLIDKSKKVKYSSENRFIDQKISKKGNERVNDNNKKMVNIVPHTASVNYTSKSNYTNEVNDDTSEVHDKKIGKKSNYVANFMDDQFPALQVENKYFQVQKTDKPDVYNLYDNSKNIGIACVPSLKCSKFLRKTFENVNLLEKVRIECWYNKAFQNKWQPLEK
jgi:hypothetical protein